MKLLSHTVNSISAIWQSISSIFLLGHTVVHVFTPLYELKIFKFSTIVAVRLILSTSLQKNRNRNAYYCLIKILGRNRGKRDGYIAYKIMSFEQLVVEI